MQPNPRLLCWALLAIVASATAAAWADDKPPETPERGSEAQFARIHLIDFDGEIDAMQRAYLLRRFKAAREDEADCVVVRITSPGGTVSDSKLIGDALLELGDHVHTVAWIPFQALSGAAWVTMACHEILMAPGATFGDCMPIVMSPTGGGIVPVGEKVETAIRASFRAYAERRGHPPLLAQAMVSVDLEVLRVRAPDGSEHFIDGNAFASARYDDVVIVEGDVRREDVVRLGAPVSAAGKLLTLTAAEALDLGFIDRLIGPGKLPVDEAAVLAALSQPDAKVIRVEMGFNESAGRFLLNLSGVLAAVVALGVALFLWQGSVLGGLIAGTCLVLILLISATAEHINGFPLFLVFLGLALLAVEILLLPGFGVPGALGVFALALGVLMLSTGTSPTEDGPPWNQDAVVAFGLQFSATILLGGALLFFLVRALPRTGPGNRMVLATATGGTAVPALLDVPLARGAEGTVVSPLRPAGRVRFGDTIYDVLGEGDFIETGAQVVVDRVEGTAVTVRRSPRGQA